MIRACRALLFRAFLYWFVRDGKRFSEKFYLGLYPDIVAAGVDPYEHYVRFGRSEGRIGVRPSWESRGSPDAVSRMKETILIVCHEGSRTGAPVLGYNLVRGFLARYNVITLFLGPGPMLDACHAAGAMVIGPVALQSAPPHFADLVVASIARLAPIKFAMINSIESRYVLPALATRFIATVSLIHEFAAYTRPRWVFREALFWSSQAVFSSNLTLENLRREYPDLRAHEFPVIPQGRCVVPQTRGADADAARQETLDLKRVMRPPKFPEKGVVVLSAGLVQISKGVDLFIDCAARVSRLFPDLPIRFVWIGKGYDPENDVAYSVYLADQILRAGLEDRVAFHGEVSDLEAAYALADCFVLTSRLDPLPNVAIDALSTGLPVICFEHTTGIADLLSANGLAAACVAPYLDTQDMALKIVRLTRSDSVRHEIAARSKRLAAASFDMERYITDIERLAVAAIDRARQEKNDVETISRYTHYRLDFFLPPHLFKQTREEAMLGYVRSWASEVGRRKLFPGFHPGIFREHRGAGEAGKDPLAAYLDAGQPKGPWRQELITADVPRLPVPPRMRIGLHIHAYYPDMFPDIIDRLLCNKVRPDLLVSVASDAAREAVAADAARYTEGVVDIRVVPNRGRDIGPFLTEFGATLWGNYDLIGHLHTKKTPAVGDAALGRAWHAFLMMNLLGGPRVPMADIILGRMAQEHDLGLVFPDDPNVLGWATNRDEAEHLGRRFGLFAFPDHFVYPVGTMFWARTSSLERLFAWRPGWADFPAEPLGSDGTMLHAIERLLPFIVQASGARIAVTNVAGVTR